MAEEVVLNPMSQQVEVSAKPTNDSMAGPGIRSWRRRLGSGMRLGLASRSGMQLRRVSGSSMQPKRMPGLTMWPRRMLRSSMWPRTMS